MFDFLNRSVARDVPDGDGPSVAAPRPFRPKIGLALGSGAARGWAHIGIIHALREAGYTPDIVTGTSIGAIVGGCFLAGKLDKLEDFALSLSKRRMLTYLDIGFGGSGLMSGARLSKVLRQNLGDLRIEEFNNSFVSVATELGTGHEIWLRSGDMVNAIRASYALPGIFQPVQIGGRWLVDGALVNPVPVSVARALGARVVIAVTLHSDVFGRGTTVVHPMPPSPVTDLPGTPEDDEEKAAGSWTGIQALLGRQFFGGGDDGLPGISGVMMEAFNIIQDRIGRSRLAGDPPDITIGPKLGSINLLDFQRAEEAIAIGYETGRKAVPEIAELVAALSE
ncbi:MAG: NTE family protein rssA [Hyphomicrobiales bacterium]|nr:MAG: NTE family protein rssA [Hyphomicrobiales bacterium]